MALLATNTIAQGDTREVGLDQMTAQGFSIPRAVPSVPWPGEASLEVAQVWLHRGAWPGEFVLNEQPVAGITPFLTVPGALPVIRIDWWRMGISQFIGSMCWAWALC